MRSDVFGRLQTALLALLFALAFFPSCGDDDGTQDEESATLHDDTNANVPACGATYVNTEAGKGSQQFIGRMEMPRLVPGDIFIVHQTTDITSRPVNFSVAYNAETLHSRWVAFRFDATLTQKNVARKDYDIRPKYPRDPLCSATPTSDASFGGHDHGHLCASADRLCSRVSNDQTFYMSNMSPQIGSFNQQYWTKYEQFVQTLGRACTADKNGYRWADTLYVVKGGTIDDGQTLGTVSVDKKRMPVPKYYFIALLKVKNQVYSSIAFWVEHSEYDSGKVLKNDRDEVMAHAISVDELERRTGIDFFCNLSGTLEHKVESTYMSAAWEN